MTKKLSTAFYPQTNGQTKRQNGMIEVYFRIFVNWEQNDWVKLLPMAEFAYNNAKNASTSRTVFKFNYGYYFRVCFKDDVDSCSKSCFTNKLAKELRELMKVYC